MSCISALAFVACSSSVKKADIPVTANPKDEISKLETDILSAVTENIDVLASDDFKNSKKWLSKAKSGVEDKDQQNEILDNVRQGRGYLNQAYATATGRAGKATGLFESRQAALRSGASTQTELASEIRELDSEVSDSADRLGKISAEDLAKLQGRYVDLERKAVVLTQLGKAQAEVIGSRKDGAAKQAPMMLKKAEMSLKTAESLISTNVRNPQGFSAAVAEANDDAKMLMDVMETIKQSGSVLPEASAIRIVQQNRQIATLKTDKATTARQTARETANAAESLGEKTDLLSAANAKVEIQRIMEQARQQFKPSEAEAFQQGDKLLIRMKNVNFASGRAELPGSSLAGLAKVSEIAKALNASEIQVEGHTDSVGSDEQNKTISEQRAGAVASYFQSNGFSDIKVQSVGYGFSKPVATNKSKAGRALNRRVDIIITPQTSESSRN